MFRSLLPLSLAAFLVAGTATAAELTGSYVEARTCDVWTGACFGNAEMNLAGRNAIVAWKLERGTLDGVCLDGLAVVAVIEASDTLGLEQTSPAKAVLLVDARADAAQREGLVKPAKQQGGEFLKRVISVQAVPVSLAVGEAKDNLAACVTAGDARIRTRRLDRVRDRVCGGEGEFYPPRSKGVKAEAAMGVEHSYTGKGFSGTWKEADRRGAYMGTFVVP